MDDGRTIAVWTALAFLNGALALSGFAAGHAPLLPIFMCGVALACAAHRPTREHVMSAVSRAGVGSPVRALVLVLAAALLVQTLPFDLALLMAGDVLAYVEVLAAVSVIAANARWMPLRTRTAARLHKWRQAVAVRIARSPRAIRTARPPRIEPPPSDDGRDAGALAFA